MARQRRAGSMIFQTGVFPNLGEPRSVFCVIPLSFYHNIIILFVSYRYHNKTNRIYIPRPGSHFLQISPWVFYWRKPGIQVWHISKASGIVFPFSDVCSSYDVYIWRCWLHAFRDCVRHARPAQVSKAALVTQSECTEVSGISHHLWQDSSCHLWLPTTSDCTWQKADPGSVSSRSLITCSCSASVHTCPVSWWLSGQCGWESQRNIYVKFGKAEVEGGLRPD